MYLNELASEFMLEDQNFECKLRLNENRDKSESKQGGEMITWMKCVGGMANNKGGTLFVGVEDSAYKVIGFTKKEADEQRNFFNNAINQNFSPEISYVISFIKYSVKDSERFILKIDIPESKIRPITVKYKGIPGIYIHENGYVSPANYEDIKQWVLESTNVEYDSLPSNEIYHEDNFKKLQKFYSENTGKEKLSNKALQSMGFFDNDGYLKNGALLFSDDYKGSKTSVACTLFSGITRGDQILPTINEFQGNIIDSIYYMQQFVTMRMNHRVIKNGNGRTTYFAYPERALFEGIINAVAHRDYFINGGQIQMDIFQDRIEISSPGNFYNQKELSKTYDLKNIISARRNTLICNILVACEVMEAKGTGFEKIMADYATQDQNHQPYVISTRNHFTLVLPDLTYEKGIINSDKPQLNYQRRENESVHDNAILMFCYREKRSAKEIANELGIANSSYLRNTLLASLVKDKYLITSQSNKTTFYRTNEKFVSLN